MYTADGDIYFDDVDQCNTCAHSGKGPKICPLLEALVTQVADWAEPGAAVIDCDFYEKKVRHLKLLKCHEGVGNDKHDDPTPGS